MLMNEDGIAGLYLVMWQHSPDDPTGKHAALSRLIRFIYDCGFETGKEEGIEEGKKLGQPNVDTL